MKYQLTKLTVAATSIATLLLSVLFPVIAQASANARLYLTPASQSYNKGSSITLSLMLDSGGNSIYAWRASLNYSTSYFSSVSVTTDPSSPFSMNPNGSDTTSGGVISISRFKLSASGDTYSGRLATITLQSTGAVGNTDVNFDHICTSSNEAACSNVYTYDGSNDPPNVLGSITGSSLSFVNPPATGGSGTSSGGSTKSASKSKVAAATPAASTPAPTSTTSTPTTTKTTTPKDMTSLTVKVVDQNGKAVEGAQVKVDNQYATTDSNGQATFLDIATGQAAGSVTYKGVTKSISIQIDSSGAAVKTVSINVKKASAKMPVAIAGIVILVLIVAYFTYTIRRHRPKYSEPESAAAIPSPTSKPEVSAPGKVYTPGGEGSQIEDIMRRPME